MAPGVSAPDRTDAAVNCRIRRAIDDSIRNVLLSSFVDKPYGQHAEPRIFDMTGGREECATDSQIMPRISAPRAPAVRLRLLGALRDSRANVAIS